MWRDVDSNPAQLRPVVECWLKRWNGKRHTKYYNKRPAGEERSRGYERSACLLSQGASRAANSTIGQSRARMRVDRDRMESGRVLTTTKCMAPKEACLHHCRFPSDRSGGRRVGRKAYRWWRGSEWPRNRRPDELNKRLTNVRFQT